MRFGLGKPTLFGRHRSPQRDPHVGILENTMGSLLPGGPRVSDTGRKGFTGGGIQPQKFVRASGAAPMPNDPEALSAPMAGNARRALNRGRGRA